MPGLDETNIVEASELIKMRTIEDNKWESYRTQWQLRRHFMICTYYNSIYIYIKYVWYLRICLNSFRISFKKSLCSPCPFFYSVVYLWLIQVLYIFWIQAFCKLTLGNILYHSWWLLFLSLKKKNLSYYLFHSCKART